MLLLRALSLFAAILLAASIGCADSEVDTSAVDRAAAADTSAVEDAPSEVSVIPGVFDDRIVFGQSAALNGPAKALGNDMKLGIEAAFAEASRQGGVNGRLLDLRSRDDSYRPENALINTIDLIEIDQVFALIGATGTPTSEVTAPAAADRDVPYIAPFTGAEFLRDGKLGNVVNLRASYAQETETLVALLTEDMGIKRIGVMFQDDSFGRDGYRGARAALARRGLAPVAIEFYTRNTVQVKNALLDLVARNPDAVIIIGTYEPAAELILWARRLAFDPVFATVSFVGADALAAELGLEGAGVFVTQVVPFPMDLSLPVVADYNDALRAFNPSAEPSFVSLEGYLAGRLAIEGLKLCSIELTRDCFLDALLSADHIDISGLKLAFGVPEAAESSAGTDLPTTRVDNQGSNDVFLTVIDSEGQLQSALRMTEALP